MTTEFPSKLKVIPDAYRGPNNSTPTNELIASTP